MTTELIGYADKISVSPDQALRFHVSTECPEYNVTIVRLVGRQQSGQGLREEEMDRIPACGGRKQVACAGSYAIVKDHPAFGGLCSFTVQMWIFPTRPEKLDEQGLLCRWSESRGFALVIGANGELGLWLGDETGVERVYSGKRLASRTWCFVCACVDARARRVTLTQAPLGNIPSASAATYTVHKLQSTGPYDSHSPLLMAVTTFCRQSNGHVAAVGLYNGKIDRPALFGRSLSSSEIGRLERADDPSKVGGGDLIGAWDLSLGISTSKISDMGKHNVDGWLVNMPTRAVTDHLWDGEAHDYKHALWHYNAIHFHEDDLEDARWEADFEWRAPTEARSGFYAARLSYGGVEDYVPFFVRPKTGLPKAKIVVIAPTMTYLAYANERLPSREKYESVFRERSANPDRLDEFLRSHPEFGLSLYDRHSDGSGCCYSSYLRPIPNMRPNYRQWLTDGPRHLGADLNLIDWLEQKRFAYDVITDHDLHSDGVPLLKAYKVAITGTHPEYWTARMLIAMREYLDGGGRLMYLGGNGFYWVTAVDEQRSYVVEVRRGNCGTRTWSSEPGESYLSSTGELGGLWRHRGSPPNMTTGLGMAAMGYDAPTPGYWRQPGSFDKRAEFIFKGVGPNDTIGSFGSILGGAAGDEIDRMDYALGTPPHALLLASVTDYSDLYMPAIEELTMLSPITVPSQRANVRADMVYFETPNGGGVFSVGSITWCGSLAYNNYNNNVSQITENVLKEFSGV